MCATFTGPVGNGETRIFSCNSAVYGRYLVVLLEGQDKILTLCEVQVFEGTDHSDSFTSCLY
jgi:hypothetical protein